MNLIVAVDKNWGIGCEGGLLFHIPADLKYFKEKTLGQVVVMGHNTLKSLPGGRPLKDRVNIVLSRQKGLEIPGVTVCHEPAELKTVLKPYEDKEVWVIGGAAVYELLYEYCAYAYVTRIEAVSKADRFFPNLDESPDWELTDASEVFSHEGLTFRYLIYKNLNLKKW